MVLFQEAAEKDDSYISETRASSEWAWVKINVDAFVPPDEQEVGFGVVLRDYNGKCFGAAAIFVDACWDARLCEVKAVLQGIEIAKELGLANVVIEGDAAVIIRKLS